MLRAISSLSGSTFSGQVVALRSISHTLGELVLRAVDRSVTRSRAASKLTVRSAIDPRLVDHDQAQGGMAGRSSFGPVDRSARDSFFFSFLLIFLFKWLSLISVSTGLLIE